jgi:adenylate cyclase
MRSRRARVRALLLLGTAVAAVLIALGARAVDLFESLELNAVDARYSIRGGHEPRPDIVTIALDGRTLSVLGLRPPLPRSMHARVMDTLHADGARLIAYDFQFEGPDRDPLEDAALLAAIKRARPLLATHDVDGPPLPIPFDHEQAAEADAQLGSVGLLADADGKIRRMPYSGQQARSFEVEAAEAVMPGRVPPDRFPAWIDYPGPPKTVPTYSFLDVLRGDVKPGTFRDKIVVVGASDPIQKDVFPTPTSSAQMPGAEIHAAGIATILDEFPLRSSSSALDLLLIFAFGLAAPLMSLRLSGLKVLAAGIAILATFLVAAQLAFDGGTVIEVVYPLLSLVLALGGSLTVEHLTTTRERQRLRRNFVRFVPAAVVEDVMSRTDDDLRLGGVTLEATVLFCDLRGFTRWAETKPASTVIETLNRYLTEMSEAILAHGGTVVSYMGDGIMAVFGAPIDQPDHAERALGAAREMFGVRLGRFNAWLEAAGLGEPFRMGIGLNSGPVSSGNVGSEERIEYAAVGDTTNVAARLESHCKETEYQLLLSDTTRSLLGDGAGASLVEVGSFTLRGRQAPTRLWSDGAAR